MNIAIIKSGVVENIIVADGDYEPAPGRIAVEATPDATIGGTWDGGVFGPAPTPPATEVRLTVDEFLRRIGPTNWQTLDQARPNDAQLNFAFVRLLALPAIRPGHADVIALCAYCVAQNYLTQQDADLLKLNEYREGETGA